MSCLGHEARWVEPCVRPCPTPALLGDQREETSPPCASMSPLGSGPLGRAQPVSSTLFTHRGAPRLGKEAMVPSTLDGTSTLLQAEGPSCHSHNSSNASLAGHGAPGPPHTHGYNPSFLLGGLGQQGGAVSIYPHSQGVSAWRESPGTAFAPSCHSQSALLRGSGGAGICCPLELAG